jgi:peptidoglycan/xylan/chitin deacetylase (PgdA/CDA1 family)
MNLKRRILILFTFLLFIAGCNGTHEPIMEQGKILVLMYHRISPGEPANEYERSVTAFESDLQYLLKNHINILSFNDLEEIKLSGSMPLGNSVIITFDDGDQSWYNYVRPLLIKYKMKATFFLWTYMMGQNSFITWDQVEEMSRYTIAGGERAFVFGSHSFSHAFLLQSKGDFATDEEYNAFLDYQLGVSKSAIEEHVPEAVNAFSLPYGDGAGDPEILAAVTRNGYKFVRTSIWGNIPDASSMDLLNIPSLPILDTTTVRFIQYYLNK